MKSTVASYFTWLHHLFVSSFIKSLKAVFGTAEPFQKTNSPTAAPKDPPPTSLIRTASLCSLGEKEAQLAFVRNLQRKWCNLGCFSSSFNLIS